MAEVVDLASRRPKGPRKGTPKGKEPLAGKFRLSILASGNINLRWLDDKETELLRVELDPEEADALCSGLRRAILRAKQAQKHTLGFVLIAWCRTNGTPVRNECVQGRIVRRADTCVWIVIEPEPGTPEPRGGWPPSGWYRFDGWLMGHHKALRDWRVISGMPRREARR